MIKKSLLKKYAKLIATSGINIKKNQVVTIRSNVTCSAFTTLVVEECYKAGASEVFVDWSCGEISKLANKYQSLKTYAALNQYEIEKAKYLYQHSCARISLSSSDPDGMKNMNMKKLMAAQKAMQPLEKYAREPYMDSKLQWCVAAVPNEKWAKKVFPTLSKKAAMEALWDAILNACRINEENDPVKEWDKHNLNLANKSKVLNDYCFESLHYTSSNGTDFTVGLVKHHIWAGGAEGGVDSIPVFNPNIPTEEVFTMPHKDKADGIVYSTKPLLYQRTLIEDFSLTFKDGKVIKAIAKKGQEALNALLATDEGSTHLGEVALVPYHSPISMQNILFYNTLFDENASCHLALGNAYSTNIENGPEMEESELLKLGYNKSMNHVDFMIGSKDLRIVGTTKNQQEVVIFQDGDWTI